MRSWMRSSAKMFAAICIAALVLEVTLRVATFAWYGGSQYHLYYGFHQWVGRVGISPWSTFQGEYYKFPPKYLLHGAEGQGRETASINSHGFRGPEFAATKPAGVFRVVCLGESSTFGYHNSDTETYPFLLQKLFDREDLRVEVINAGFPYYNSGSIVSLLNAEILQYQPDLITLYAGYNDTSWPMHVGFLGRVALRTQSHSITYLVMRNAIRRFAFRVEQRALEGLIPQKLRADELRRDMELVADRYRRNVLSIIETARRRGIDIVLIKQPVTAHGPNYETMSYERENEAVRSRFERGEQLSYIDVWMLKQYRLMEELEKIASAENVPLVDNVKIVDQDRRRLASWVHLTDEGNERLADALNQVIKPYVLQKLGSESAAPCCPPSGKPQGSTNERR